MIPFVVLPLLLACGAANRAPRILSVNGILVERDAWGGVWLEEALVFAPGETLALSVDVVEPDAQAFEIWWPKSPPGWDFPKDGTTGSWAVPLDYESWGQSQDLIVTDTAAEPAFETIDLWLAPEGGYDTAFSL